MNPWNLIPWSISLISLLLVIGTYMKNNKKDLQRNYQEEDAKYDTLKEALLKANYKLDQLCTTTNETRLDIKTMNKDLVEQEKRISILERDVKSAFHQIEELRIQIEDK